MSYSSRVKYTATAGQTDFDYPFPYLDKLHIQAVVSGVSVPFTWVTTSRIHLNTPASLGAAVTVKRVTPQSPLVDFESGHLLVGDDLNTAIKQALYREQEIADDILDLSVTGVVAGVSIINGQTGEVTLTASDVNAASIDLTNVSNADFAEKAALAGVIGGGGGGVADWNTMVNKPSTFAPAAHTHPQSDITGLVTALAGKALLDLTNVSNADFAAKAAAAGVGGGGGGSSAQKPALLSEFGTLDNTGATNSGNDAALLASEASSDSAIYVPDGVFKVGSDPAAGLTKHYVGRGILLYGTSAYPANFSYMAAKPSTYPTQGLTGWFRGDQRFTDGGEYRVIGPTVRSFDLNARYFESNTIPHHAWFDANSGSSGVTAYLTNAEDADPSFGPQVVASAGSTIIKMRAAADSSWVGKTVGFANNPSGTILETRTISAVNVSGGHNIQISSGLTNTYTWDPNTGLTPCIYFAPRTWAGHTYVRVTAGADGGGDVYGHVVRTQNNYVPKATEKHPFMANTPGMYGGDQYYGADGQYGTAWESQTHDNNHDVAHIAFVQSLDRNNDSSYGKGRFWLGTLFKSEGTRPVDVGHVLAGKFRNGLDTVSASFQETAYLQDPTIGSGNLLKLTADSARNAVRVGDPVTVGDPVVYTGTVDYLLSADAQVVAVTPALPSTPIAANTIVTFSRSGAALHFGDYHRIVWGGLQDAVNGRSGDKQRVYPAFYGNRQGDIVMESGADGSGRYWSVRFPKGSTSSSTLSTPDQSRLRLRTDGVQIFGNLNMTGNFAATGSLAAGSTSQIDFTGTGISLRANGGHLQATINGGSSWSNLL